MGFFPFIAAGAGAIFGGLSGKGQAEGFNDDVRAQNLLIQKSLNEDKTRLRRSAMDQQAIASDQFNAAQAQQLVAMNFGRVRAGHSINRLYASTNDDFEQDDQARKTALAQSLQNIETEKQIAAANASNQLVSETGAMVSGAISGAQQGYQLGSAAVNIADSLKNSSFLKDLNANLAENPTDQFLQSQALAVRSGVPVSLLRKNPALATSPFLTSLQTQGLQMKGLERALQSATNSALLSTFDADKAQRQLDSLTNSSFSGN